MGERAHRGAGVGRIAACIRRAVVTGLGIEFLLPEGPARTALIRRLYTEGIDNSTRNENALAITLLLLSSVLKGERRIVLTRAPLPEAPDWILAARDAAPDPGWSGWSGWDDAAAAVARDPGATDLRRAG